MTLHKRNWLYIITLALITSGILSGSKLQDKYFKPDKSLAILSDVLNELDAYYVDEIDSDAMIKAGIDAMLYSLDPYTTFFPEEDSESLKTFTTGEYGGIGAIIGKREEKTAVIMLYKDCPAQKGGLRVGDEISRINGEDMTGRPVEDISSLLKGTPGTSVQLSVTRYATEKPLAFTLAREKVILKNVPYHGIVEEGVGYIRLVSFMNHAADEVAAALTSLEESGMEKLILDLRGNPGGLLEEAIKVVNLFIESDRIVVSTKGRVAGSERTYTTTQRAYDPSIPIVVLIDQKSSSASEIVAGVLQDYDRGVLVGKNTFGKGLVQTTRPLSYNTQLKLTVSKYYIPSGRSIQKIDHRLPDRESTPEETRAVPKKVFTTQTGRRVYEGNGVTPDLEVDQLRWAPITASLIEKGLIFDYATVFRAQEDHIVPAQDFVLSTAQYRDFVTWLADKDYTYTIEPSVDLLLKQAQEESYTAVIREHIALLKAHIQHYKEEDLRKFEEEIKAVLQEEIIARYYYQEGATEAMLTYDPSVRKACVLFQDIQQYYDLLKANE